MRTHDNTHTYSHTHTHKNTRTHTRTHTHVRSHTHTHARTHLLGRLAHGPLAAAPPQLPHQVTQLRACLQSLRAVGRHVRGSGNRCCTGCVVWTFRQLCMCVCVRVRVRVRVRMRRSKQTGGLSTGYVAQTMHAHHARTRIKARTLRSWSSSFQPDRRHVPLDKSKPSDPSSRAAAHGVGVRERRCSWTLALSQQSCGAQCVWVERGTGA